MQNWELCILILLWLTSCTVTPYEPGDGDYSYLRADFSMMKTDGKAQMVSFVTDDGDAYNLLTPVTSEGLKADTTYRALVYYDVSETREVRLRGITSVGVVTPKPLKAGEKMKNDPLHWESMWISKDGSHLNLGLRLMVGADDKKEAAQQVLGFVSAKTINNKKQITLYHDQNGVPEYYSYQTYVSVPIKDNFTSGEEVTITVNTYDGIQEKTVVMP